jgi:hypothetical protein
MKARWSMRKTAKFWREIQKLLKTYELVLGPGATIKGRKQNENLIKL